MANEKDLRDARVANLEQKANRNYQYIYALLLMLMAIFFGLAYVYLTQEKAQQTITVGAGPYQSDSHELLREVADVVERNSDWLRLKVVPTRDSSQNISLLNEQEIDVATIRSDTPVAKDIRLVANMFPDYFQILTRGDRSIFQVINLIGKKVAIPRFGTDEFRSFWVIGDHYDIPINGVKWIAMDFEDAAKKLLSGELDALFTVRSLRDPRLLNLFADAELKGEAIRFLPIHQAPAIALKRAFLRTGTVPLGAFIGKGPTPLADTPTVTVHRLLVSREDIDPEIIRELTRILFEYRLDLTIRFTLASAIRRPETGQGIGIPLHDGAEQYYTKDEPTFVQENAEPLALMVTVFAMLASTLVALRSRWVSTQKDRMDTYNYVLLDIADVARKTDDPKVVDALKTDMFSALERVVRALDRDEITDTGFQSYSRLWDSVRDIVNERERDLKGGAARFQTKQARPKLTA